MKVISKSKGPNYNGLGVFHLTPNKSYKLVSWSLRVNDAWVDIFPNEGEKIFIPERPLFYIDVIADDGKIQTFWNDYFYSTLEMREKKFERILGDNN